MRISCLCSSLILATAFVFVFVLPFDVIWRTKFGSLLRGANSYWMLLISSSVWLFWVSSKLQLIKWFFHGPLWEAGWCEKAPNIQIHFLNVEMAVARLSRTRLSRKKWEVHRCLEMSWVGKGNAKNTQEIESDNKFASHLRNLHDLFWEHRSQTRHDHGEEDVADPSVEDALWRTSCTFEANCFVTRPDWNALNNFEHLCSGLWTLLFDFITCLSSLCLMQSSAAEQRHWRWAWAP